MRNAKTPVKQLTHVPQMPSVLSTTPFLSVPCLAHVCQVLLEKETNAVTKYVSSNDNFLFRIGSYFQRLSLTAVIPEAVGCESDQECSNNEACDNGDCINPCANSNPCSSNAICFNENHRANCRCPPGFTGDPFSRCVIRKLTSKIVKQKHYI